VDQQTRTRLIEINRRFYVESAAEFGATRNHAWPGWERVMELLQPGKLRVLDAGCGNGRLAAFLGKRWTGPVEYLGLDSSDALLTEAKGVDCAHVAAAFEQCELLGPQLPGVKGRGAYDLIAVYGLMHHVPAFEARVALLASLAALLAPSGLLAVTLWRFAASDRFDNHVVDWRAYNAAAEEPVDTAQLERGDYLLRWGAASDVPRYCHDCDDAESERLIAALCEDRPGSGLSLTLRFHADGRSGRLNDYLLFSAARAA
jgi:SAM-dependent methyltransferase